jgi:hypothetical protein
MGETISFAPRKAIKSQVLADFVAEWVDTQLPAALIQLELWTMYFDGSLMKTGAGAGLLFISPLGKHLRYVLCLHFPVLSAFRDRGVPEPTSECRRVPQPRWVEREGEREGGEKRGGRRPA